jgi:GNAT superfamily N-acetyltransferase
MKIVTLDQLPRRLEPERLALGMAAFSGVVDRRALGVYVRRRIGVPEYVGLFALEGGELVGQTLVIRIPFRTPSGPATVAGISSVTTRLDARGRGVATALLEEAHRREAAAGQRFAMLWTSQGWFAHRLYEKLGYRDVFTPPIAVREVSGKRNLPGGSSVRSAKAAELAALEALHDKVEARSLGFSRRANGFLRAEREAGYLDLDGLLVYRRRGRRVGYAAVSKGTRQLRCGEIVAAPQDRSALLDALERRASPGLLVLGNTPVLALEEELRVRGYALRRDQEWRVLMACPLQGPLSDAELHAQLGVDEPSFVCMSLDRF